MEKSYITKSLLLFILLLNVCCSSYTKQDYKAQKEFLQKLEIIEKFLLEKGTSNGEILDNAVEFIESLTNIKSDFIPGKEITLVPSEQNLKDWKKWYEKNKKRMFWDEKEQKVKLKL
ncbi:MAG: hypothetical protein ACK5RV_00685 [Flavobacterium sp.]|jgi:hypothetical protein|uniref:hypothetical protein n=1 Tax=Flavobacterium sp. TaxID=239 RepID=UPI0022BC0D8B|nr:hypothetical protein [Flavobacterium sp.]MCZ8167826.1 hypothetical protein [Flavobacterium sp.]